MKTTYTGGLVIGGEEERGGTRLDEILPCSRTIAKPLVTSLYSANPVIDYKQHHVLKYLQD